MEIMEQSRAAARRIAVLAAEKGGRAYFVGGCVRDRLLERAPSDIDIEVHGMGDKQLERLLSAVGTPGKAGKGFEIYNLSGTCLNVSLPKKPGVSLCEAAARRDFTVNALMEDVLTGEVLDFFGGKEDLKERVIRHIGRSLSEDPVRVLRAARFAADPAFEIAPETKSYMRRVNTEGAPPERVMNELSRALLSPRPSRFFEALKGTEALSFWFREAEALIDVPQNPGHHTGDAWEHTMLVLDEAAACREQAEYPLYFMLAALCHDLGKSETTVKEPHGRIHAPGHPETGAETARAFLSRITREKQLKKYVCNMVRFHMEANRLWKKGKKKKDYMLLFDRAVCPGDLLLLAECDIKTTLLYTEDYSFARKLHKDMLKQYYALLEKPYIRGEELIELGVPEGPLLGEALGFARRQMLKEAPREETLEKIEKKWGKR